MLVLLGSARNILEKQRSTLGTRNDHPNASFLNAVKSAIFSRNLHLPNPPWGKIWKLINTKIKQNIATILKVL